MVHSDLCCSHVFVFEMNSSESIRNSIKLDNFSLICPNDPTLVDNIQSALPHRMFIHIGVLMWEAFSKGKRYYEPLITSSEGRPRKLNGEKLSKT
ncbi:unnamed protein product [Rotaria sp. Silwood1]|nr:unnamed protein product [Rotaria sp. Silwood1]CAF4937285.1 unnamed protein product [Rotaria sp. Silwood1]CAF4940800.1 unnamed protein product [Rotaria sp. Silwood1]CAF4967429.1 unnamed protein product [Rotaria sp. Silwood1]CAF4985600.1 unnamed protein product [Rotaria sp. Silwood1]